MTAAAAWLVVLGTVLVGEILGVVIARAEERRERMPVERLITGPWRRK